MNTSNPTLPALEVPEELVPHMPETDPVLQGTGTLIENFARSVARTRATAELGEPDDTRRTSREYNDYWNRVDSIERHLLDHEYAQMHAHLVHAEKLRIARAAFNTAAARSSAETHRRALYSCPICTCTRYDDLGLIGTKTLSDGTTITACGLCFRVAQAVVLERISSEVVKGPRTTRATVVQEALVPFKGMGGGRRG